MKPVFLAFALFALAACSSAPESGVAQVTDVPPGCDFEAVEWDKIDCEVDVAFLRRLAAKDNALAQYLVGAAYALGDGIPRDDGEADKWFRRAVDADSSWARMIGDIYFDSPAGKFRPRNIEKAIHWYERAAKGGDSYALVELGRIYEEGNHVPADPDKAFDYFTRAAEAGAVSAHDELGSMYFYGIGRPVDYELARMHYLLAARSGEETAMRSLGRIYEKGLGTDKNLAEALRWFTESAKGTLPLAPYDLGKMYRYGFLDDLDRDVKALSWFLVAALRGSVEADRAARHLYLRISAEESQRAAEMAEAFVRSIGQ